MTDTSPGSVTATLTFEVTDADTARAVGSGSLPVLGTPRLLAWCEAATCAALEQELADGATSVGTRVQLEHTAASRVGSRVRVEATRTFHDGRLHRFSVAAREAGDDDLGAPPGRLLGTAEITRMAVDADRFLARLDR